MTEELETARRYRLQAEELRTIASESCTPKIRATLLQLAKDYQVMAITLEAIDQTNRTLRLSALAEENTVPARVF
jgi:hypothetical protein